MTLLPLRQLNCLILLDPGFGFLHPWPEMEVGSAYCFRLAMGAVVIEGRGGSPVVHVGCVGGDGFEDVIVPVDIDI